MKEYGFHSLKLYERDSGIGKPVISVFKRNPANLIAVKKSRKLSRFVIYLYSNDNVSYGSHAGSRWMETRLIHEWL